MLDQVTQGIIDILRDTASEIRRITDQSATAAGQAKKANAQARANAVAGAQRLDAADPIIHKLREVLRIELERQCALGAGTFTIDDGFAQSGLWQVSADFDSGSLIAALARAQSPAPR